MLFRLIGYIYIVKKHSLLSKTNYFYFMLHPWGSVSYKYSENCNWVPISFLNRAQFFCSNYWFYRKSPALVFGLELKFLVLWWFLLLTCTAPTHALMHLGKNTFISLNLSPIDAGTQNCTQGAPPVKARNKHYVKIINWDFSSGSKNYADICAWG